MRQYLRYITDVAHGVVKTQDMLASSSSRSEAMDEALKQLSKIRFDNELGYFWVTDNKLPYPTMLMHADSPQLKNQVLNDGN